MKRLYLSLGLGIKFIILVIIVVSFTLAVTSYFSITHDNAAHYNQFKQRAQLLAEIVSVVSPEAIFSFDYFSLNENIKNISDRDVVILCAIMNKEGQYITNYYNKLDPRISEVLKKSNSDEIKDIVVELEKMPNIYIVNQKILFGGEELGSVELIMSTLEIYNEAKNTILVQALTSLAIILILSISISIIFKRAALNRIDELISCAENVSQGNLDQIIVVENSDELGRLGGAFNNMVQKLKSSIGLKEHALKEVGELNKTLESKVETRTLELNSKNHELSLQRLELEKHRDNLQELIDEKTRDLVEAKNLAESANMAKSNFLANMSHELRTPMHAILSFSRIGIKKADSSSVDKTIDYFSKIEKSGDRLLLLLNDLLDLSKLESGKQELDYGRYYLSKLASDIVDEFVEILREKNIDLNVVNNEHDNEVYCDQAKIGQVIRNLISNAVKFTESGTKITITIADEDNFVRFEIEDEGIGVPEAELESVFDKFVQSSKTKTGAGGTGLGLPISKEIISLHHGSIAAELGKNGGAIFWFTLKKYIESGKGVSYG